MNGIGWDRWLIALGFVCFFLWPLVQEAALCLREARKRRTEAVKSAPERSDGSKERIRRDV